MEAKLKTVAYCRVSTNKEEQLDSLESQRSFFLEYAKKNQYELINIYADEGKSGTRIKNRLQLQQLLIDAKENKFELVLIKDVSRLARNTVDFLTSIRKLKSCGIKVVFVNYDQTSSDSSEFMLTMLSAIAQEESANTSKRIKFGKRVNAEKGRVPNFCYGYDKIKGDYFSLEINEEEAEVVKKIFKMYTKENLGSGRIAKKLNQKGIKTKRDCEWTQTAVTRILTNELYIGKVVNAKEEVVDFLTGKREKNDEDKWIVVDKSELQIISEKTYYEASVILKKRKAKYDKTRKRTSDKYTFSKLIWCDQCGYHYRRIVRTYKNTYIRWVCNGRNSKGIDSCSNNSVIDEEKLIIEITNYICNVLDNESKCEKYLTARAFKMFKERNMNNLNEKDYHRKLNKLQKERKKYINLYKEDIICLYELQAFIAEIKDEMYYLNKEIELINKKISKKEIIESVVLKIFLNLDKLIKEHKFTNNEMRKIIEKIIVDKEGLINIYIRNLTME